MTAALVACASSAISLPIGAMFWKGLEGVTRGGLDMPIFRWGYLCFIDNIAFSSAFTTMTGSLLSNDDRMKRYSTLLRSKPEIIS